MAGAFFHAFVAGQRKSTNGPALNAHRAIIGKVTAIAHANTAALASAPGS